MRPIESRCARLWALAAAWQTGAAKWNANRRLAYANYAQQIAIKIKYTLLGDVSRTRQDGGTALELLRLR